MTDVNSASSQAVFVADVDFSSTSNVEESQLTDVTQQDLSRSKPSSEHFKLPEGLNGLQLYAVAQ